MCDTVTARGVGFLLSLSCLWPALIQAAEPRTNIVFILADDLGYTDVACFGSKYYETPHIGRMADQGIRFTNGHDNPTYAAMIASVDESVGRVLKTLDELQLAERTLVIFSSDNGGVGGYEREGIKKGGDVTDNTPLRGGKGMLYEGGVRVPYIFRWPGKISPLSVSAEPINSVDLYPTLLEIAGAKPPENYPLDGSSYATLLTGRGQNSTSRSPLFWHFPGYLGAGQDNWRTTPVGAIRSGDWKLLEFFEDNRLELYNLRDDLSEKSNLADKMPDKVRELHERLIAWRKSVNAPMPTPNDSATAGASNAKTDKAKGKTGKGKQKKGAKKAS